MKSAYELAMERLQKDAPSVPLNAEQRAQIADIDSLYTAKIAEKELLLKSEIAQEQAKGHFDQVEQLQKQLASLNQTLLATTLLYKYEKSLKYVG